MKNNVLVGIMKNNVLVGILNGAAFPDVTPDAETVPQIDKVEAFLRDLTALSREYQLGIELERHYDGDPSTIELYEMTSEDAERVYKLDEYGGNLKFE